MVTGIKNYVYKRLSVCKSCVLDVNGVRSAARTASISIAITALCFTLGLSSAAARDGLKITIPRRSELTPVQRLNREGVDAIRKHQYDKARSLFYKAYLYDPTDPFTLNNLGYISEMQGQLDRAHKFYDMASKQESDATIDRSNAKDLEGKPMKTAFDDLQDIPMRVNRLNVDGIRLLADNRGFEAASVLQSAFKLDPRNPFTLNNLGVASESIGDFDAALRDYTAAAGVHSDETVVVTLNDSWRGRPVSKMAAESVKRLEKRMRAMEPAEAEAVMYTMRGVFATNQNNWSEARQAFLKAYSLDPQSAFAVNNRGYVAERDGDLETAQLFYEKARRAQGSEARIGLATAQVAEGKILGVVAADSNKKVALQLDQYSQQRRRETGPVELVPRGGTNGPDNPTDLKKSNPDAHTGSQTPLPH